MYISYEKGKTLGRRWIWVKKREKIRK